MDEPFNFNVIKGLIYVGVLKSSIKAFEKVVIVSGDKEYTAVIHAIEQFNKTFSEGEEAQEGEEVGLFFHWANNLPNGKVKIYK